MTDDREALLAEIKQLKRNIASAWLYSAWKARAEKAEAEVDRLTKQIASFRMTASESLDVRISADRAVAALERSRQP